jgi:hypothetical protein
MSKLAFASPKREALKCSKPKFKVSDDLQQKKGSGDKSYHALFHISPFFAPWYGLLHFLGQFADIGGTAHVKGLRDPFLRHAGLFRDDVR